MKVIILITSACFSFLGATTGHKHEIDTNRDAAVLDFKATRIGGRTYVDSMDVQVLESMDLFGQPSVTTTEIVLTSEMEVTDLVEGGQQIHSTITAISMSVHLDSSMFSSTLECDGDEDPSAQDGMCADIFGLVDTSFDYLIDDQGQIYPEDKNNIAAEKKGDEDMSPAQMIQQTSRMMKLLTDVPVQPGDTWDVDTYLDDSTGYLTGISTLKGYTSYKGHDCAVISTSGDLTIDMDKIAEVLGDDSLSLLGNVEIRDATMISTLYWDNEDKIARWSEASISMVMIMNSPLDGTKMEVNVDELVTVTSDFKE